MGFVEAVAEAVRLVLAHRRLDTGEVASALHLHREALRRRLDAGEPFDVSELERIAELLQIDVYEIFDLAESGSRAADAEGSDRDPATGPGSAAPAEHARGTQRAPRGQGAPNAWKAR